MAKSRKVESRNRERVELCSKQPKSRSTKRLSLSFLLSSSTTYASCQSNLGSFRQCLSCVKMSEFQKSSKSEKSLKQPLIQCTKSTDERSRPISDFYRDQFEGVESVRRIAISDAFSNSKRKEGTAITSKSIPEKLQIKESNNICCTPKNILCAESTCQLQWPDGVIGETRSLAKLKSQLTNDHLVQSHRGHCSSVGDDLVRDGLKSEDHFSESSCESGKFSSTCKEALERKEDLNSGRYFLGSTLHPKHHYQPDNSSSQWASSRITKVHLPKRGKIDRDQKHEICFDELAFPLNSLTEVRRFKIMRHLGLVAPIGSPF